MKKKALKKPAPPVDVVTFSVDIGVQLPKGVNWEQVTFHIPHNKIVPMIDGAPIRGAIVITHTTTGPVDSFKEEDLAPLTDEEIDKLIGSKEV
jgi:hypothetical protein